MEDFLDKSECWHFSRNLVCCSAPAANRNPIFCGRRLHPGTRTLCKIHAGMLLQITMEMVMMMYSEVTVQYWRWNTTYFQNLPHPGLRYFCGLGSAQTICSCKILFIHKYQTYFLISSWCVSKIAWLPVVRTVYLQNRDKALVWW